MKYVILQLTILMSISNLAYGLSEGNLFRSLASLDAPKTELNSLEVQNYQNKVIEVYEIAAQIKPGNERNELYSGYLPNDLYEEYYGIVDDLYIGGIAPLSAVQGFNTQFKDLYNLQVPNGVDPKDFWRQQYQRVFTTFFNSVTSNPQKCAGVGVSATVRQCCAGLVKHYQLKNIQTQCLSKNASCTSNNSCCSGICKRENTNQMGVCEDPVCKSSGQVCNSHSDCCSSLCRKSDLTKPGTCQSTQLCYQPQVLGGDCSPQGDTPVCGVGNCLKVNSDSTGLGQCKARTFTCTADNECCSGKCEGRKCVDNYECRKCAANGAKPQNGEKCCSGYLDSSTGKCRVLFMPGVNTNKLKTNRSIFEKVFSFIFPVAHAQTSECSGNQTLTSAQIKLLSDKSSECSGLSGIAKTQCDRAIDDLRASYCKDNNITLTNTQQSEVDTKRQACVAQHQQGSPQMEKCLEEATEFENSIRKANTSTGTNNTGVAESGNRFEDFQSKYNAPTITAKTYSDAKNCFFNSFNDNWKAASNVEKNAELFLRSFEYVYVGKGTQDYWQDGSKGNVFKRANKVAKAFRKNRNRILERTREIDKEISCKCIAIWGPEQFPQERQDYFKNNCAEEAKELSQKLATGVQDPTGEGSNVDGTTITQEGETQEDKLTKDAARMEEIDKGALALSHEKLLIEFLQLRSEAQMDRFVDNQELEKELDELSEFISGTNFEEVWKDEIKDGAIIKHSPPGDSRLLYKWGFKYLGGLLVIILIVVAVAVGAAFGLAALAIAIGAAVIGAVASAFLGSGGEPGVADIKIVDGKKYSLIHDWDGFERWYVGPLFDNKSAVSETHCRIYAKASACLKSAYAFSDGEMKYLNSIPANGHFIIDPKLPPFVAAGSISIDKMPVYNKTWVQIMNETVDEGVNYLKTEQKNEYGIGPGTLKEDYLKGSKSNLKDKPMEDALAKKYFIPFRGSFVAKDFDKRQILVEGATKYARCKELTGNTDISCNGQFGVTAGDTGYGYLFETDEEAREWAEYTYEMHYVYSSVSKDTYMGYPLLGMDVYFQAVAYNMKVVGSMAAERSKNYSDTADLYQADWEKRKGDYQSLGEGTLGTESRNIKYNKPFYDTFEMLSFDTNTNIEQFDAAVAKGSKAGTFNKSELGALTAARQKAIRSSKDIKKQNAFKKDVKNLAGGDIALRRQSELANTLQRPINAIISRNPNSALKKSVLGSSLGKNSLLGANSSSNSNNDSNSNKNKASDRAGLNGLNSNQTGFGNPGSNKFGLGSNGYGGTNYGSNYGANYGQNGNVSDSAASNSSGNLNDQGMSTADAQRIVNAYANDDNIRNVGRGDSLFTIVSKAYKRNYSKVLTVRSDLEDLSTKKEKILPSEKDKAELRKLLKD